MSGQAGMEQTQIAKIARQIIETIVRQAVEQRWLWLKHDAEAGGQGRRRGFGRDLEAMLNFQKRAPLTVATFHGELAGSGGSRAKLIGRLCRH